MFDLELEGEGEALRSMRENIECKLVCLGVDVEHLFSIVLASNVVDNESAG
jgi:hypothetical protein